MDLTGMCSKVNEHLQIQDEFFRFRNKLHQIQAACWNSWVSWFLPFVVVKHHKLFNVYFPSPVKGESPLPPLQDVKHKKRCLTQMEDSATNIATLEDTISKVRGNRSN